MKTLQVHLSAYTKYVILTTRFGFINHILLLFIYYNIFLSARTNIWKSDNLKECVFPYLFVQIIT